MDPNTTLKQREILVHDMCLRDGMHAKREQISTDQMVAFAKAMDAAGVPMIQVSHGAGLGGHHSSQSGLDQPYVLWNVLPRHQ